MKPATPKEAIKLYQETVDLVGQARQNVRRLLALAGDGALLTGPTRMELSFHFDELTRLLGAFAERQINIRARLLSAVAALDAADSARQARQQTDQLTRPGNVGELPESR
jgi:hypothetical protein